MKGIENDDELRNQVEQFFDEATMVIVERMKIPPMNREELMNPSDEAVALIPQEQFKAGIEFRNRLLNFLADGTNDNLLCEEIFKKLDQYL